MTKKMASTNDWSRACAPGARERGAKLARKENVCEDGVRVTKKKGNHGVRQGDAKETSPLTESFNFRAATTKNFAEYFAPETPPMSDSAIADFGRRIQEAQRIAPDDPDSWCEQVSRVLQAQNLRLLPQSDPRLFLLKPSNGSVLFYRGGANGAVGFRNDFAIVDVTKDGRKWVQGRTRYSSPGYRAEASASPNQLI